MIPAFHRTFVWALALAAQCSGFFLVHPARAEEPFPSTPDSVIQEIAKCLREVGEYVVDPQDPNRQCVLPRTGVSKTDLPFNVSPDEIDRICRERDRRAFSGDLIKRIVAQTGGSMGPMGIRILGGVYCEQVNVAGLDLKYSLILDKAVFTQGIAARNLRVAGDFSIDDSLVFGALALNRARIDGSFYHSFGFVQQVMVSDTKIEGTWHQSGTVILKDIQFRGLTMSGDIDLSESALGRLAVDASQVRGGVILNDSEARCGYDIRTSDIGYILAEEAGFGKGTLTGPDGEPLGDAQSVPIAYPWWSKLWTSPPDDRERRARTLLTSPAVRRAVREAVAPCKNGDPNAAVADVRFVVLETQIKTNFCLRSFRWLRWPSQEYDLSRHPRSELILSGTNIDTGLIVTFEHDGLDSQALAAMRKKRTFEAKGLTAGSLTFDFSEGAASYGTELDGLKFGRMHTNLTNCEFKSELPTGTPGYSGTSVRPQPPKVEQVVTWLETSRINTFSSQPFTAFADAFQSIGEHATALRVARASQELTDKTSDWWATPPFPFGTSLASLRATFLDSIPIFFQWGLWAVADHGFRPGKVVYWVLGTLLIFWWIFWFGLKIVAFEPEQKIEKANAADQDAHQGPDPSPPSHPRLLPIGFLFLFDRLIPAIEIREENYSINNVYRRISPIFGRLTKISTPIGKDTKIYKMRYLRMTHALVRLEARDRDRLKRWLLALRVIGVAWGVFLLAALNELIKH
jgi:hypothetical protein